MTKLLPIILYHAGCADGTGAALAAYLKFRDDAVYLPVNYGEDPPEDLIAGSPMFILDFSYSREILLEMKQRHPDLVVLDHHKTSAETLKGLDFAVFDMDSSGAVMAWRHFHPGLDVPEFFLYIQDRDLWRFAKPMSYNVSLGLRSYPLDFRTWDRLNLINKIESLAVDGAVIRRSVDQAIGFMVERTRFAAFDMRTENPNITFLPESEFSFVVESWKRPDDLVYIVPVVNATVHFSEVGEALLKECPNAKFAAYYFDRGNGIRQWGLRSREGFFCSWIAQRFGGGGHAQAAGFETDSGSGFVTRRRRP